MNHVETALRKLQSYFGGVGIEGTNILYWKL